MDYFPEETYSKRLKEIDPRLKAEWNLDKWIITRDGKDYKRSPQYIMTVRNKDNSFRPLDQRTLKALRKCDTHRYPRVKDFVKEIDDYNEAKEKEKERKFNDMSSQIAEESRQAIRKDLGMGRTIFA